MSARGLKARARRRRSGQSFVELVIFTPVLLLIIMGMTEVTFIFNTYLEMTDASRNSGRYVSDNDPAPPTGQFNPSPSPNAYDAYTNCLDPDGAGAQEGTQNFFRVTACEAIINLLAISPTATTDYVVVSVFQTSSNTIQNRFDDNDEAPANVGKLHIDTDCQAGGVNCGAVFFCDINTPLPAYSKTCVAWQDHASNPSPGTRADSNYHSAFSTTDVQNLLQTGAPDTGFVLVEIFYQYNHVLNMPYITAFIPNPLQLHAYAMMPLAEAADKTGY